MAYGPPPMHQYQRQPAAPAAGPYPGPRGNGYAGDYQSTAAVYDDYNAPGGHNPGYYDEYNRGPYGEEQGMNGYYGAEDGWGGEQGYNSGGYSQEPRGGYRPQQSHHQPRGTYNRSQPPRRGGPPPPPSGRNGQAPPGRPPRGDHGYGNHVPPDRRRDEYAYDEDYSHYPGPSGPRQRGPEFPRGGHAPMYDARGPPGRDGRSMRDQRPPPNGRAYVGGGYENVEYGAAGPRDGRQPRRPPPNVRSADDRNFDQRPGTSSGAMQTSYPPGPERPMPLRTRTEPSTVVGPHPEQYEPVRRGYTTHMAPGNDLDRDYGLSRPNTAPESSRLVEQGPRTGFGPASVPPYPPGGERIQPSQQPYGYSNQNRYYEGTQVASPIEEMPAFDMPPMPTHNRPAERPRDGRGPNSISPVNQQAQDHSRDLAMSPQNAQPLSAPGSQRRQDHPGPFEIQGRPSQDAYSRDNHMGSSAPRGSGQRSPIEGDARQQVQPYPGAHPFQDARGRGGELSNDRPPPIRPGLLQNNSGSSSGPQQPNKAAEPNAPTSSSRAATQDEIFRLREQVRSNPKDNKAQLDLAKKLATTSTAGQDYRANVQEAQKIVKSLVQSGYPDAMFYLADCIGEGALGQTNDPREAFNLYQAAAKAGHAAAAYRTAVCCEIGPEEGGGARKDLQKAFQWYKHASSLGDIPATYKMGIILLKGLLGQEKSPSEAVSYLKKAADAADEENPHALHELAALYESPNNEARVPQNEAEARQLFTKAAKLGYKFSQFKLGQAHEYGSLGCPVDARTSIVWYTRAASQGEHQSELALSGWYLTGSEGILQQSDSEAYLWAKKAASSEPPLPKAMFAMGYYLEVGIGAQRSLEEAKKWYSRAASHNFPKARERLEELRKGGVRVAKTRETLSRSDPRRTAEDKCNLM